MKFLVIDTDIEFRAFLEESGHQLEFEPDADRGFHRALTESYDLLILDAGIELLRRLREHSQIPILILSAHADPTDRVMGLRAGADDYMAKPFHPEELLARAEAILRRAGSLGKVPDVIQIGELRLLPASRDVYFRDQRLDLTSIELEILECLMGSFGKAVSRDRLSLKLYNRLPAPFERNIDTHVSRIRRKMGIGRGMILSVRGTGYQIVTLLHKRDESNPTR
jgi:DNA-binding response OmpR family regulator